MNFLNLKTLGSLLLGAAPMLAHILAGLPGPYAAVASSIISAVLLHVPAPKPKAR